MSGIGLNAFEDDDWIVQLVEFVRDWHGKTQKPMFGACFGHQIIARAMGSRVGRNHKGWEVSVCEIALSKAGEELFEKKNLVCLSTSVFSFFVRVY
jgi:GMP synthase-like glutamine amidotransferase